MTKREMYNLIITVNSDNAEIVDFCKHQIELLDNKSNGLRKPTKTQQENEILLEEITDYFNNVATEPHTIAMLQANIESLTDLTNQKVSALLKKLVDSQVLVKFVDKKKTFFALPTE